jgi:hypothetical protein
MFTQEAATPDPGSTTSTWSHLTTCSKATHLLLLAVQVLLAYLMFCFSLILHLLLLVLLVLLLVSLLLLLLSMSLARVCPLLLILLLSP